MSQTAQEWVASYAAELGVDPPSSKDFDQLLELAGIAAHASERTAAPITCWLAAQAGVTASAALAVGRRLAGETQHDPG
jgi:hypothetical protein